MERSDLDLVVTATPWQLHAPVCVAAMKAGKHACTEVPAALTVEQCWELVDASEKSGKHCTMLEQPNYSEEVLAVLNMAQQGLFGEIVHATGGYVHDLRLVKFDPEREPWRLQHSIDRNGNVSHSSYRADLLVVEHQPWGPLRPPGICQFAGRDDQRLCLPVLGPKHPYASVKAAQGDVNTSILRTADGKTVVLHFDTNTPHPQTSEILLQGTRGLYSGNENQIYIEGRSPAEHQWEPLKKYVEEFLVFPFSKQIDPKKFKSARGHGGGTETHVMWVCILDALMNWPAPRHGRVRRCDLECDLAAVGTLRRDSQQACAVPGFYARQVEDESPGDARLADRVEENNEAKS